MEYINFLYREKNFFSASAEDAPQHIPMLYISSPSSKDPTHEERCPGRFLQRLMLDMHATIYTRATPSIRGDEHIRSGGAVLGLQGAII